jgi:hypothetical protein
MSAGTLAKPILDQTFTADMAVNANVVVVASGTNMGNVKIPAAAGALSIIGVTVLAADNNNVCTVRTHGVAQCRILTGTAINVGDQVKIADSNGRVTKISPAAGSSVSGATLKGVVGTALSAVGSGAASDTLLDVLLTPGVLAYE